MLKKAIFTSVIVSLVAGLFYLFVQRDRKYTSEISKVTSQPIVSLQKINITEEQKNVFIQMTVPRIIIFNNYTLESEVNKAISRRIDSLQYDFMSAVTTAAEDNGEANTLHIETEILLMTPRLISLVFTATKDLSGINDDDPERTFLVFDLSLGEPLLENNELFRDDIAWGTAVQAMKAFVLSNYKGHPRCDLSFAPKLNGFAVSCIGVDYDQGGDHVSITGDMPISTIQEFVTPPVLSDIISKHE